MNKNLPTYIIWILIVWVCFVFLQSLFFKFQGHEETQIIFSTISDWMAGIGLLAWVSELFRAYGGILIGATELIAVALLITPKTRTYGAWLGLVVISGAIFFHLATPLGIVRTVNVAGDTDGGALFFMACSVWISCAGIILLIKTALTKVAVQD